MKTTPMILACALAISMGSCEKDDLPQTPEPLKAPLVANVYDFNHDLLAHYVYTENDQLIKRAFTDPGTNGLSDLIFHYENDLVSIIDYVDYTFPGFSHETHYFYNDNGTIDKIEMHQGGQILISNHLNYSEQGLVESVNAPGEEPKTFYDYDSHGNVTKTTKFLKDPETGEEYTQECVFEYDTGNKANFGLNYLIGIELLPKGGGTSVWEKDLSQNNLLSEGCSGYKLRENIIEYNENGFPKSITTEWEGWETETPMIIRIAYLPE